MKTRNWSCCFKRQGVYARIQTRGNDAIGMAGKEYDFSSNLLLE